MVNGKIVVEATFERELIFRRYDENGLEGSAHEIDIYDFWKDDVITEKSAVKSIKCQIGSDDLCISPRAIELIREYIARSQ